MASCAHCGKDGLEVRHSAKGAVYLVEMRPTPHYVVCAAKVKRKAKPLAAPLVAFGNGKNGSTAAEQAALAARIELELRR